MSQTSVFVLSWLKVEHSCTYDFISEAETYDTLNLNILFIF